MEEFVEIFVMTNNRNLSHAKLRITITYLKMREKPSAHELKPPLPNLSIVQAVCPPVSRFIFRARSAGRGCGTSGAKCAMVTCDLDHPKAPTLYQQAGFVPDKQEVKIIDDPRLTGLI